MTDFIFALAYWAFLMLADPEKSLYAARLKFWDNLAPKRKDNSPWRFCSLYRHPRLGIIDLDQIPF